MSLVTKFKTWLKNEVKVDYESIAVDVRGMIEHVEAEFTALDKKYADMFEGIKKTYDNEIKDLKDRLSAAVEAAESAEKRFSDWLDSQTAIKVPTDTPPPVPNPPAAPVVTDSSAQSAATAPTVGDTGTPAAAATTNNAAGA